MVNIIIEIILIPAAIIAIILILIFILKKLKKVKEQKQRELKKQEEIRKSFGLDNKIKNPKQSLLALNKIAQEFLKEHMKHKQNNPEEYEKDTQNEYKRKDLTEFLEEMNYLLYSGREITKQDSLNMINKFNLILKKSN